MAKPMRLLALSLLVCLQLIASTKSVEATGVANLSIGVSKARDEAIEDAQRNAVKQALGAIVQNETMLQNYELVYDTIKTKVQGYLKSYSIAYEGSDKANNIYKVTINAQVEELSLADDVSVIANILPKLNYPTISVMMQTSLLNLPSTINSSLVQNTIQNELKRKGFRVVHSKKLKDEVDNNNQALMDDMFEQMNIQSDIVVFVDVDLSDDGEVPYYNDIHSYSSLVSSSIYETQSAKFLGSAQSDSTAGASRVLSGIQEVMKSSAKSNAEDISAEISNAWLEYCYHGFEVKLSTTQKDIEPILKDIKDVKALKEIGKKGTRRTLLVTLDSCNIALFINQLKYKKLAVKSYTSNSIILK
jgi:hypothetical protein